MDIIILVIIALIVIYIKVMNEDETSSSQRNTYKNKKNNNNNHSNYKKKYNNSNYSGDANNQKKNYSNNMSKNPSAKIIQVKGETNDSNMVSNENYGTKAEVKGETGETLVRIVLGKNIENEQYVIHNLIVEDGEGQTSQIDHVLINEYGIWVIETKNWSGEIYGNDEEKKWVQVLPDGKLVPIYSPVKQNWKHIFSLKKFISDTIPIHSLVVILHADISNVDSKNVVYVSDLKNRIAHGGKQHISVEEINECYQRLYQMKVNQISDEEHTKNVLNKRNNIILGSCPKCGKKLRETQGEYGKFYFCEDYPECKFLISEKTKSQLKMRKS